MFCCNKFAMNLSTNGLQIRMQVFRINIFINLNESKKKGGQELV